MAYNVIKEHMEKYLEGQIAKHTINAQVFMKNPVGVAEHPDTMATIEEELGKISEYKDKLYASTSTEVPTFPISTSSLLNPKAYP